MLVAVRRLFSMNCQFREDGKVVGEMERSLWRETAELELDDGSYSLYRDQVIGGDRAGSQVTQTSTFRRTGLCSTAFFFFGFAR